MLHKALILGIIQLTLRGEVEDFEKEGVTFSQILSHRGRNWNIWLLSLPSSRRNAE